MKIRIKKITPLQAGKMLAAIYALLSVIIVPIMVLMFLFAPRGSGAAPLIMVIVMPLIYIAVGFVGGIIGAFIYNLVAGWIGGIEVEYEEEKA